eukprot:365965-Chlamydomonas_euryale.AAC.4
MVYITQARQAEGPRTDIKNPPEVSVAWPHMGFIMYDVHWSTTLQRSSLHGRSQTAPVQCGGGGKREGRSHWEQACTHASPSCIALP